MVDSGALGASIRCAARCRPTSRELVPPVFTGLRQVARGVGAGAGCASWGRLAAEELATREEAGEEEGWGVQGASGGRAVPAGEGSGAGGRCRLTTVPELAPLRSTGLRRVGRGRETGGCGAWSPGPGEGEVEEVRSNVDVARFRGGGPWRVTVVADRRGRGDLRTSGSTDRGLGRLEGGLAFEGGTLTFHTARAPTAGVRRRRRGAGAAGAGHGGSKAAGPSRDPTAPMASANPGVPEAGGGRDRCGGAMAAPAAPSLDSVGGEVLPAVVFRCSWISGARCAHGDGGDGISPEVLAVVLPPAMAGDSVGGGPISGARKVAEGMGTAAALGMYRYCVRGSGVAGTAGTDGPCGTMSRGKTPRPALTLGSVPGSRVAPARIAADVARVTLFFLGRRDVEVARGREAPAGSAAPGADWGATSHRGPAGSAGVQMTSAPNPALPGQTAQLCAHEGGGGGRGRGVASIALEMGGRGPPGVRTSSTMTEPVRGAALTLSANIAPLRKPEGAADRSTMLGGIGGGGAGWW